MNMFKLLFSKEKNQTQAQGTQLFMKGLAAAKEHFPELFKDDTPATSDIMRTKRFEAIALFMSAVLWRLHLEKGSQKLAQATHDIMFLSFDRSLREGGVGDIGVSHKIKKYAQAFYGRLERYTKAFEAESAEQLCIGIEKNIGLKRADAQNCAHKAMAWAQELRTQSVAKLAA